MKWLYKLEKITGKFAIRNLMMYIVVLNFLVFALDFVLQPFHFSVYRILQLDPSMVFQGQVWRLITFIFIPPSAGIIFIIFVLYFYYMIGSSLEQEWGTARFNLYYLIGILGTIAASLTTGNIATSLYLNMSLFLAFAQLYPDYEVLLFFILPVKIKYLAYVDWVFFALTIIFGSIPNKIFAAISLINFFLFFYDDFFKNIGNKRRYHSTRQSFNSQVREFKRRNNR